MLKNPPHRRTRAGLLALALAAGASGCGGTKLTNMWKDPGYAGPSLRKVLVIGIAKDQGARRLWEETFSSVVRGRGVEATPLHTIYSADMPDTTVLRQKVQEMGYDGVVVARATGLEREISYVPGYVDYTPGYYANPYWGYYGAVVTPGYVTTDEYLHVETRVYSTAGGAKLIWTGTTETMNPSSATEVSREISETIVPELAKRGIF